ncbi:hypothetical protein LMG28138_06120 [Pararobbsia alpina]|uniref:Uncharacterized protein n=1 Tax=Pararobbsia alpina TaxID=621374 RepID=A0A6S7BQI7_9BURK|nr:hypothetical protein LMG28138_06120 [Pararobbsia alpina]
MGGVNVAPLPVPAIGQVVAVCVGCTGLGVLVAVVPSPPPSWPTTTSDVGTAPGKLLVRLIVNDPGGVVITTGDQFAPAPGFDAAHEAGATVAAEQV